jgi:(p)ppGpp synthase/HD superfamily hydrolase
VLLSEALAAAAAWHGGQRRKDGSPYLSHLLQVAGLVLEHGGTEVTAAAALLHDAVEDTAASFDDVHARFGPEVERIVRECTDTLPDDARRGPETWRARKEHYLAGLATHRFDSALVSACDKRHNLGTMVRQGARDGAFHASVDEQRWFFGSLARILRERGDIPDSLVDEIDELVAQL